MSYIPHTDLERQQMLSAIGVPTIEDLFEAVPSKFRFPKLDLPAPMTEMEVIGELRALAEANDNAQDFAIFRGAGAYNHYVPSAVNHIIQRGEFLTAYTPYQPEVSQGTLQAIFEYQSMITQLTGMDGSNASHYDGATSLAESVTVALESTRHKRTKVILSPYIHPDYRAVTRTYHQGNNIQFVGDDKAAEISDLVALLDDQTAMLAVSYPNFLGQIEDFKGLADQVHEAGALLVFVANPMALALFKSPGELGADIVVGEGQPLGIGLGFGGPYLGFFSTKMAQIRRIAGRVVGETLDQDGKKAYVMTLRPREQDIRREKATSNICTNTGLMALAATVYMELLGKKGLRQVAELSYHKAHYAADQLEKAGFEVDRSKPFFNEFVVKCPVPVKQINEYLIEEGIIGGYDLGKDYPYLQDRMLVCVTEVNSKDEIDVFVSAMQEARA